jgi:hypothetical protein
MTTGGQLLHALRYPSGRWQSLGKLDSVAGSNGVAKRVFAAGLADSLHVLASGAVVLPVKDPNVRYGDSNGNGTIDVRDAILTLRFITRLQSPTDAERKRADAVIDGQINISDVTAILRCAAGLGCSD